MRAKDYCNCTHAQVLRNAIHTALMELTKPQPSKHERAVEILSGALKTDKALREAYESEIGELDPWFDFGAGDRAGP